MSPLFSVLLPVTRPPVLLPFAVESVLEQSVTDFELLVICDGAPPETIACAEAYAERDSRVKVFTFPKGARHGEEYRDRVLAKASGSKVAIISDDDLWFPNHLEEMERLLSAADFGNLLHVYVRPDGAIELLPGDLGQPEMRQRMIDGPCNFFGLSFAGYRLEAYLRLPEGWAPAPPDIWSDLFMWRKFLAMEGLMFATRAAVTALHFATPERQGASLNERQTENRRFLGLIRDPRARKEITEAAWHSLLDRTLESDRVASRCTAEQSQMASEISAMRVERTQMMLKVNSLQTNLALVTSSRDELQTEVGRLRSSTSWRLTAPLRRLATLARRVARKAS